MRRLLTLICLAVPALTASAAAVAGGASPQPEVISTRQTVFAVPFSVSPPRTPQETPGAFELIFSADHGATWKLGAISDPRERRFVFRAPHDGEFWFFARTRDRNGQIVPEPNPEITMRVHVDTAQPAIQLNTQRTADGQVEAQWQASDANLDPNSLRIEYRVGEKMPWEYVYVDATQMTQDRDTWQGTTVWLPPNVQGTVAVQAEVADKAGNRAMTQSTLAVSEPADQQPLPDMPNVGPQGPAAAQDRTAQQSPIVQQQAVAQDIAGQPPVQRPPVQPYPTDFPNGTASNFGQEQQTQTAQPNSPGSTSWPVNELTDKPLSYAPQPTALPAVSPVQPPVAGQVQPPAIGNASLSFAPNAAQPAPPATAAQTSNPPAGVQTKYVDSFSFELDYDVRQVVSGGVRKVDLWGTQDNGRTWTYYGTDLDRRSPFFVTVPTSGVFGFRLVIYPAAGMDPSTPRTGDPPQIMVYVRQQPSATAPPTSGAPSSQGQF